ncbi:eukaryotic translation initiation factor 1A, isoform CRA_b [Rattus norvegicus]|uniref:Eukaryotic translation initiation factor 1A, isoform CRA_b n=1 Tax=Rattus norvegicus TaxID=10116 RepID=A6IWW3_RAT|nr:eukaryotic translation initiation factor 1A, isoform CRA_b [Rattus norvegicus]
MSHLVPVTLPEHRITISTFALASRSGHEVPMEI